MSNAAEAAEAAALAAVYDAPDDDAPRRAFAALLERRGDPRGTFIVLQLDRAARGLRLAGEVERRLLAAHQREWIPPEVARRIQVKTARFERGFLTRCQLRTSSRQVGSAVAGHPGWRTVEAIHCDGEGHGANHALLAPELGGLRHLSLPGFPFSLEVIRHPAPRALETLDIPWWWRARQGPDLVTGDEDELVAALVEAPGLPNLRHLALQLCTRRAIDALLGSPLAARLERITLAARGHRHALASDVPAELRDKVSLDGWPGSQEQRRVFGFE